MIILDMRPIVRADLKAKQQAVNLLFLCFVELQSFINFIGFASLWGNETLWNNIGVYFSKCSKPNCKSCSDGQGHGPYIYAKKRIAGRQIRKYLGKELPGNLDEILGITDISGQILQLQTETYKILKLTATVECNGEKKDIILYKHKA